MSKKFTGWLVITGALIGLCLLVFSSRSPRRQSIRMPDGNVVTFLRTDYGTNLVYAWGKPYQELLYKILPKKYKSWANCTVEEANVDDADDPVFWLHQTRSTNDLEVGVIDEYGCEHYWWGGQSGRSAVLSDSGALCYFNCRAPFQGRIVGLCLYDSSERTNLIGTFIIPGAVMTPLPTGKAVKAKPYPPSDLSCELESLNSGLKTFPPANGPGFTQMMLKIYQNGIPTQDWIPETIRIVSKNSRIEKSHRPEVGRKGKNLLLNFDEDLDTAEGPVKFEIELVHKFGFSPDELVMLNHVPFPAPNEILHLNFRTNVQGETVMLETFYGEQGNPPDPSLKMPDLRSSPRIEARFFPPAEDVHFQPVSAKDEAGQPISTYGWLRQGDEKYWFFLESAATKTVDLTFAVHRSQVVEFEAIPASLLSKETSK